MNENSHIIGKRAHAEVSKGTIWGGIVSLAVGVVPMLLIPILDFELFDMLLPVWIMLFVVFGGIGLMFVLMEMPKVKNNKNLNPTITLSQDGTFVLIHINGKKEILGDKILRVEGRRYWRTTGSSTSGNIVTTYRQEIYDGNVVFLLEKPTGEKYSKKVYQVMDCKEVASKISAMLK